MPDPQLECRHLRMTYGRGPLSQTVLDDVGLSLNRGEKCAVVGPSGSGKTTLLSILGGMLSPSNGEVVLSGRSINFDSPRELIELRRRSIGFVFQHAMLLPFLSLQDNLEIVAANCGVPRRDLPDRLKDVSEQLGIGDILHKRPGEISGGQRQRAAIARAILHHPVLLLADEPTAALDWENGEAAVRLLVEQATLHSAVLIMVTHDTRLLPYCDRVFGIEGGKVFER